MANQLIPFSSSTANLTLTSSSNFQWSDSSNQLAIGGNPTGDTYISLNLLSATQCFKINRGTTAQKTAITGVAGLLYFDTDLNILCQYLSGSLGWQSVGYMMSYAEVTATWTGPYTVSPTSTIRINSLRNSASEVFTIVEVVGFSGTATGSAAISSDVGIIPAGSRPDSTITLITQVTDNGTLLLGRISLSTAGTITIQKCAVSGADITLATSFSGSGTTGLGGNSSPCLIYTNT